MPRGWDKTNFTLLHRQSLFLLFILQVNVRGRIVVSSIFVNCFVSDIGLPTQKMPQSRVLWIEMRWSIRVKGKAFYSTYPAIVARIRATSSFKCNDDVCMHLAAKEVQLIPFIPETHTHKQKWIYTHLDIYLGKHGQPSYGKASEWICLSQYINPGMAGAM